ncbi:MAG: tetratricopeptide repeat protein [Nitrospinae bacterium]|nr:tetratricopeptide repeat protein [Nitrospinota bacterium]
MNKAGISISFVVISGGLRPEPLRVLINSITSQKLPPYEIILVGKAPGPLPDEVILLAEPLLAQTGAICAMRNKGIKTASGEVVVLTDDDVEFTPGWGGNIKPALADQSWDIAGCRVLGPDGQRWYDWCWHSRTDPVCPPRLLEYGEQSPGLYISGCLMMIRRRVFATTLFNENLLNHQRDDVEFCHRAADAGFKFASFPSAVAIHHLAPAGRSVDDPAFGDSGYMTAIHLFRKGDYVSALEMLGALEPSAKVLYHKALTLQRMGRFAEAELLYRQAAAQTRGWAGEERRIHFSSWFHMGEIMEAAQNPALAEEYYRKALKGYPEHKSAAEGLARVLER